MEQRIVSVVPGSIAEEMEIEAGDVLVSVNGQMPEDVFDYRYLINEEQLLVLIRNRTEKNGNWRSRKNTRTIWGLNLRMD